MTDLLQSLSKDLKPLNNVILLREQLKTTNVALEVLNRRLTGESAIMIEDLIKQNEKIISMTE